MAIPKQSGFSTVPRLTILVGKGGVGRSTLTAALGLVSARRGLNTVMVETASRQSIPSLFGMEPLGYRPVRCAENLHCIRVTWEDALREYGLMKLKFRAMYRLVFENPFVRRLLPAIPGISDILVIGKILHVATDGLADSGRPDAVILDSPATGHGLSLFAAPKVVSDTVPSGPMAEDARRLRGLLLDRTFTRFHIVTTPEEMPVAESVELFSDLGGTYGLPFGPVLVNGVQRRGLQASHRRSLSTFSRSVGPEDPVTAEVEGALFMAARYEMQRGHVSRLKREVPLPVVELPDLPSGTSGNRRVKTLADHLDAVLWREQR